MARLAPSLLVLALFGASHARADDDVPALVLLPFEAAPSVSESTTQMIESLVLVELAEHRGVDVLSSADVAGALSHEATRQALGCSEQSSCLAAVLPRLGAGYIVTGDVARIGSALRLGLVLLDAETSRAVARESVSARTFQQLSRLLPTLVGNLLTPLTGAPLVEVPVAELGRRMGDPASLTAAAITGAVTMGALAASTMAPIALATVLMPFAGMAEFELVLFPAMLPLPIFGSAVAGIAAMIASTAVDFAYGQWSIGRMLLSGAVAWSLAIGFGAASALPVLIGVSVAYSIAWNFFPGVDPVTDPRFLTAQSLVVGSGILVHLLAGAAVTGAATAALHLGGIWLFPDDEGFE